MSVELSLVASNIGEFYPLHSGQLFFLKVQSQKLFSTLHSATYFSSVVQNQYSLSYICEALGISAGQLAELLLISRRSAFYVLNGTLSPPQEALPLIAQLNQLVVQSENGSQENNSTLPPDVVNQLQLKKSMLSGKLIRQEKIVRNLEKRTDIKYRDIWHTAPITLTHPDTAMQEHVNRWVESKRLAGPLAPDIRQVMMQLHEARAKLQGMRAEFEFIGQLLIGQNPG